MMLSFLHLLHLNFMSIPSHLIFFPLIPSLLIIIIFLFTGLHFSASSKISYTTKRLPPSPPRLPIIGNVHLLGTHFHRSLWFVAQHYGPIMLLHFGQVPVLVISSPDGANEIMKTQDLSFANRPELKNFKKLFYNLKDVIASPYGEHWKQIKSILVVHLLNKKRVRFLHSLREEETTLMIRKIRESCSKSVPVHFRELFVTLANDVSCRAAFGMKFTEGENGEKLLSLMGELSLLLASFTFEDYVPMLGWLDHLTGMNRKVKRVAKGIDEFLEGLLQERKVLLEKQTVHGENFVDLMLKIQKDDATGIFLSRDGIKGILMDAYVGGTDAISSILEWAMAELLRNSNSMKKLQNEVREVVNGKVEIGEDDLEKMVFLKAVVKETFRMHPPLTMLTRTTKQETKLMGYDIAAGTMILINIWGISNDPKLWVSPHEFRPERFLDSCIDFNGHDIMFTPFGAGRRQCPGISFGTAVIEYVLANLVYKFNWELPGAVKGEDMDMSGLPYSGFHRKRNSLQAIAIHYSY